VKFNDADLIGIPVRLTVSERSLQSGGVEVKIRNQEDKSIVPVEEVISYVEETIQVLQSEIDQLVVDIPFEE
jgi:prolyl-tRNA synthetase